jgi:hypothetical protein
MCGSLSQISGWLYNKHASVELELRLDRGCDCTRMILKRYVLSHESTNIKCPVHSEPQPHLTTMARWIHELAEMCLSSWFDNHKYSRMEAELACQVGVFKVQYTELKVAMPQQQCGAAPVLHVAQLKGIMVCKVARDRDMSNMKRQKRELMGIIGEQRDAMEASAIGTDNTALLEEQFESKAPLLGKVALMEEELEEVCVCHSCVLWGVNSNWKCGLLWTAGSEGVSTL